MNERKKENREKGGTEKLKREQRKIETKKDKNELKGEKGEKITKVVTEDLL